MDISVTWYVNVIIIKHQITEKIMTAAKIKIVGETVAI
jgi:hypothetical protein